MNCSKLFLKTSLHGRLCSAKYCTILKNSEEEQRMPIFQYATPNTKPSQRIYVWGCATTGALGVNEFLKPVKKKHVKLIMNRPYRLPFVDKYPFKINTIACGYGFTVLASDGKTHDKLFGTGINTDSQIGFHETRRGTQKSLGYVLQPAPINLPLKRHLTKVTQIGCGRAHTLILTDQEGLYSLGNNAYGQCGRPIIKNEKYSDNPLIFKITIDDSIKQIVCGQDHSIVILDSGKLYSFGWGADGQTGLGHHKIESQPTLILGDIKGEKIIQVACIADCVLALSDKGEVFGWGNSEYFQLASVTQETQLHIPKFLPFKGIGKIIKVVVGGTICALLNDQGEVYVWGFGILGKGPNFLQSSYPSLIPVTLFGRNEFNPDVIVIDIVCGLKHFAAITNKGDLFTWGQNSTGCLGLGHKNDQFFPLKVSVPAYVKKVACGVDHTVALCRSFV